MAHGFARPEDFLHRFEKLKKQYFYGNQQVPQGVEEDYFSAMPDRSSIGRMFENMGLDIPLHPGEPPVPLNSRTQDMVGEWWKKP